MRKVSLQRTLACGLALGLALAGAAQASPPRDEKDKEKKVERRVVVMNKDGKPMVFEGQPLLGPRGYLGVGLTDITPELRTHFGVKEDAGVLVSKVEPGSPAEKAGIRVGDVITGIDGTEVKSSWDVRAEVRKQEDGQQVPIEIWRNGKVQTVTAPVEKRERPELDVAPFFWKDGEGVLRLDRDKLMQLPERIEIPEGSAWKFEGEGRPGERIQVHRLASPREAELEKKLKDLEKRIAELEKMLEKK